MLKSIFATALVVAFLPTVALADSLGSATGGNRGSQSSLAGCTYNSAAPTLASGQQAGAQCDVNGNAKIVGTVTVVPSGTQDVNVTKILGTATSVNNGVTDAGTLRVTVSSDSTGTLTNPSIGANSATSPTHSTLVGVSDTVNLQPLLAPVILGDGVNGNNMVANAPYLYNGTATNLNRARDIIGAVSAGTGTAATALAPTSAAGGAITPVVSTAAEANHVLKASAGNFYSLTVTTGASAGYVLIHNATSAPVDGAVTPIMCVSIPATSSVTIGNPGEPPTRYSTGIVAVFSTTGCFTQTSSATAFFSAKVQ